MTDRERRADSHFGDFLRELGRGRVDRARRHLGAMNEAGFVVDQPVDSGGFRLVEIGGLR